MMDRLLVRYWCKDSKKYLNSHKLVYNDGTYTEVSTKQSPNGTYHSYIVCDWNTSELIPEQCTGLRDKNGNLVFEGDIIRYSVGHCGSPYHITGKHTEQVSFYEGRFIPVRNPEIVEMEVIGNIHENPELLK